MVRVATKKGVQEFQQQKFPFADDGLDTNRCWEYPFVLDLLERYSVAPPVRILDVGCAMNPLMHHLAKQGYRVAGVDKYDMNDPGAPDYIRQGWGGINFEQLAPAIDGRIAPMDKLPFESNSFNCVYCLSVIEHLESEEECTQGIREMSRVVAPGGLVIITEDFIPTPRKRVSGYYPAMTWDYRRHIASSPIPLLDANAHFYTMEEIVALRNRGELQLNTLVHPELDYHFTAIGYVFQKPSQ